MELCLKIESTKMIFNLLPDCLVHMIMEYIYVDNSIGRRWYIKTLPIICKGMYKIIKTNVQQKKVKCIMINERCLVHREEDFYRSNLGTFKFLQYYLSDMYEKKSEDNVSYIHFKSVKQTGTFMTKYTDFVCMGNTCCSGHGVCIYKKS